MLGVLPLGGLGLEEFLGAPAEGFVGGSLGQYGLALLLARGDRVMALADAFVELSGIGELPIGVCGHGFN